MQYSIMSIVAYQVVVLRTKHTASQSSNVFRRIRFLLSFRDEEPTHYDLTYLDVSANWRYPYRDTILMNTSSLWESLTPTGLRQ